MSELCVYCGAGPDLHIAGVCASLALAIAQAPPEFVGAYEVLAEIGRGGNSIVYRVRDPWSGREVALKKLRGGELAHALDRSHFRSDLGFMSHLSHPNIVQVYDTRGIEDEAPHYTMQLVEGGSLDQHREAFRDPRMAAQLLATLARAVQFCHDAHPPILHRDIKPHNVLIGRELHPFLTDFGIALQLEAPQTKSCVGTVGYMSPEQARGDPLNYASDLYSLGVVLYELLCGQRPHVADSERGLLHAIEHSAIVPPHKLVPKLDRRLSAIVMTALAQRPVLRYASTAAFADDLERFLRGETPLLLPRARGKRMLHWLRHNPWPTLALLATLTLTFLFVAACVQWAHDQEHSQIENTLRDLALSARARAELLRSNLLDEARVLEATARDIEAHPNVPLATYMTRFRAAPLETLTLYDRNGTATERAPAHDDVEGRNFDFRDYFRAAREVAPLARTPTIARAHRSETPGHEIKFPLAAPMFDGDGQFAGVLLALFEARAEFASMRDDRRWEGRDPYAAVLGPRDRDREDTGVRVPSYLMLVHRDLEPGAAVPVEGGLAATLNRHFGPPAAASARLLAPISEELLLDDYIDPNDKSKHRWLAAFAALGRTGYVVVVQLRIEQALSASAKFKERLQLFGAPAFAALIAIWTFLFWRRR